MNYNLSCVVLKDEDKMGFTLERGGEIQYREKKRPEDYKLL